MEKMVRHRCVQCARAHCLVTECIHMHILFSAPDLHIFATISLFCYFCETRVRRHRPERNKKKCINDPTGPNEWNGPARRSERNNHSRIRIDPIRNIMRARCARVCVFVLFCSVHSAHTSCIRISHPFLGRFIYSICRALQFVRSFFYLFVRRFRVWLKLMQLLLLLSTRHLLCSAGSANEFKVIWIVFYGRWPRVFAHECDERRVCRSEFRESEHIYGIIMHEFEFSGNHAKQL